MVKKVHVAGRMGDLALGEEYANFRAWVPRNILPVGALDAKNVVYYDWARRNMQSLWCVFMG